MSARASRPQVCTTCLPIVVLLIIGSTAWSQSITACPASLPFVTATTWTGAFSITGTGSGSMSDGAGGTKAWTINETETGTVALSLFNNDLPTSITWQGSETGTFSVNDRETDTDFAGNVSTTTVSGSGNFSLPAGSPGNALLEIDSADCFYQLITQPSFGPGTTETVTVIFGGTTSSGTRFGSVDPTFGPTGFMTVYGTDYAAIAFPASATTGSPLINSATFISGTAQGIVGTATWTISWNLIPNAPELVVSLPQYDSWRPTANRKESDIGLDANGAHNNLEVDAKLLPAGQEAKSITFKLTKSSTVPGVVNNWPPASEAQTTSDLTFEQSENKNLSVAPDKLSAETTQASPSSAIAYISPHDWGGYGELQVTAELPSGDTITGHLEGKPDVTTILLPQRQDGSLIADSWKNQHGIDLGTPDSDDSETNPAGDGQVGDGFTLYEEYRGFYMGCSLNLVPPQEGDNLGTCQHVSGDPNRKDLFVENRLGDIADWGIRLFGRETQLRVHFSGLRGCAERGSPCRGETDASRVINFNHTGVPHEVDQHALVLEQWLNAPGYSESCGGPGLPKDVSKVLIMSSLIPHARVSANGVLDLTGNEFSDIDRFDHTIAHELSHSVRVLHHGEDERGNVIWSATENGKITETCTPGTLSNCNQGTSPIPITVLTEDFIGLTANDLIDLDPDSALCVGGSNPDAACTVGGGQCTGGGTCTFSAPYWVGNSATSAAVSQHGQHSGDTKCWMRYNAAGAYVPSGNSGVRFFPITEDIGMNFTNSPTDGPGGVNNASRPRPGPRYGDAASNRGDCANQLDVNDNSSVPPRVQPSSCTD